MEKALGIPDTKPSSKKATCKTIELRKQLMEISQERCHIETSLPHQIEALTLLLEISSQFSNIISYNIDAMINLALKKIGEFDHSDRCYVFLFSDDYQQMSNTHEWCAEGVTPETSNLQDVPSSMFPWWVAKMRNRESIYIPLVDDMPPEAQAEQNILKPQGIKSLLVLPMFTEERLVGYIGFDSVRTEREWSQHSMLVLKSVAQIIASALQRKAYTQALQESSSFYQTIFDNTGAATLIIDEDMIVSKVNAECVRLFQRSQNELVGKKYTELIPEEDVDRLIELHQIRTQNSESAPEQYEARIVNRDFETRDGLLKIGPVPGTKKTVVTFTDMTEFKRIDRALKAISAVNNTIVHAEQEEQLLKMVCKNIVEIGGYTLAWIGYLPEEPGQKVRVVAEAGNNHGYTNKLNIYLNDPKRNKGPVGTDIRRGRTVIGRNLKTDPDFAPWAKSALRRGYKSCIAIPLSIDTVTFGALNIYSSDMGVFNAEEVNLLDGMAENVAHAITALRTRETVKETTAQLEASLVKMKNLLMQAVSSLGTVLDIRDPFTSGHQRKAVCLATAMAAEMGLPSEQVEGIAVAANLHDIGKINVPSEILSKPGKLSEVEFSLIRTHPQAGYQIIKDIDFPWPVAETVLQHHERLNGSGYPQGLVGDEILMEARILAVADVVEAMSSHRPYRPALGIDEALSEIETNSGILYDAEVVKVCLKLFRQQGFVFPRQ